MLWWRHNSLRRGLRHYRQPRGNWLHRKLTMPVLALTAVLLLVVMPWTAGGWPTAEAAGSLPRAMVIGTVVNAATGDPLGGATVAVWLTTDGDEFQSVTSTSGQFAISIPLGASAATTGQSAWVVVTDSHYVSASETETLQAGHTTSVPVALQPGSGSLGLADANVSGIVGEPAGNPSVIGIGGAHLQVFGLDGGTTAAATSAPNGAYQLAVPTLGPVGSSPAWFLAAAAGFETVAAPLAGGSALGPSVNTVSPDTLTPGADGLSYTIITGTVTNATTGVPIGDASVTVFDLAPGSAPTTVYTESNGAYQIMVNTRGPDGFAGLWLVAQAPGFGSLVLPYSFGGVTAGVNFALRPGTDSVATVPVSGTITDATTGKGIASATVTVIIPNLGSVASAPTTSSGTYQLAVPAIASGMPAGGWIVVQAPGYETVMDAFGGGDAIGSYQQNVYDVALRPGIPGVATVPVSGTITDATTGKGIASATVTVIIPNVGSVASTLTTSSGTYQLTLPAIALGQTTIGWIVVQAPGYETVMDAVGGGNAIGSYQQNVYNVALNSGEPGSANATITGTITSGATDQPVADATVVVRQPGGGPLPALLATTNSSGQYTIAVPTGWEGISLLVLAYASGADAAQTATTFTVTGAPMTENLALGTNAIPVTGTITSAATNQPVADATVVVRLPGGGPHPALLATTNSSGQYTIAVPTDWEGLGLSVFAYASGLGAAESSGFTLGAQPVTQNLVLPVLTETVSGTVTAPGTGAPLADATVFIRPGGGGAQAAFVTATDANGTYHVSIPGVALSGDQFYVWAVAPGYGSAQSAVFTVTAATTPLVQNLTLIPLTETVTGTVTNTANDQLIADATIFVRPGGGGFHRALVTTTNADGVYTLSVPAAAWSGVSLNVQAMAPGYGNWQSSAFTVSPGTTPIVDNVGLNPITETVSGQVTSAATRLPVAGATILVRPSGGGQQPSFVTSTNASGQYTLASPYEAWAGTALTVTALAAGDQMTQSTPPFEPSVTAATISLLMTAAAHQPTITTMTPSAGPVGTVVTLAGSGFSTVDGVWFGATPAAAWAVISSNVLQVTVPSGTGTVPVTAQAEGGVSAPVLFTYASEPSASAPSATLTVRVQTPAGTPVSGADVMIADSATGTVVGPLTTSSFGSIGPLSGWTAGEPVTISATGTFPDGTARTTMVLNAGSNTVTVTVGIVPLVTSDPVAVGSSGVADAVWPAVLPGPGQGTTSPGAEVAQVQWTMAVASSGSPTWLAGNLTASAPFCVDGTWTLALSGPQPTTITGSGDMQNGQCVATAGPPTPLNLAGLGLTAGLYGAELTWTAPTTTGTTYGTTPVYLVGPVSNVMPGILQTPATVNGQATLAVGQVGSVAITLVTALLAVSGVHAVIGFDPQALAVQTISPSPSGWGGGIRNNFDNGDGGLEFSGPNPIYAGDPLVSVSLTCLQPGTFPLSFSGTYWGNGATTTSDYAQDLSGTATVTCTVPPSSATAAVPGVTLDPATGALQVTVTGTGLGAATSARLVDPFGTPVQASTALTVAPSGTLLTAVFPSTALGTYTVQVLGATGTILASVENVFVPPASPVFEVGKVDVLVQVPGIPTTHIWRVTNTGWTNGVGVLAFQFPGYLATPVFDAAIAPAGTKVLSVSSGSSGWTAYVAVPLPAGGATDLGWTLTLPPAAVFGSPPTAQLNVPLPLTATAVGAYNPVRWAQVAPWLPATDPTAPVDPTAQVSPNGSTTGSGSTPTSGSFQTTLTLTGQFAQGTVPLTVRWQAIAPTIPSVHEQVRDTPTGPILTITADTPANPPATTEQFVVADPLRAATVGWTLTVGPVDPPNAETDTEGLSAQDVLTSIQTAMKDVTSVSTEYQELQFTDWALAQGYITPTQAQDWSNYAEGGAVGRIVTRFVGLFGDKYPALSTLPIAGHEITNEWPAAVSTYLTLGEGADPATMEGRFYQWAVTHPDVRKMMEACGYAGCVGDLDQSYQANTTLVWALMADASQHTPNNVSNTGDNEDPNTMTVSPVGVGTAHWIVPQPLTYTVQFANSSTATAPVQTVRVVVPLPATLNLSTLQMVSSSFAGTEVVVDSRTRTATFLFPKVNLPPDKVPPEGEGWVTFTVDPDPGLSTGTAISVQGQVFFDYNPPVATPVTTVTLDTSPPGVTLAPLPTTVTPGMLTLNWTGTSPVGGLTYLVSVAVDGGPLVPLPQATGGTTTTVPVAAGHTYGFAVQATDAAGVATPVPAAPVERVRVAVPTVTPPPATPAPTELAVTAPATAVSGQLVTVTATVTSGAGQPTGLVTFQVNGGTSTPVTLTAAGIAVWRTMLPIGTDTVTVRFPGSSTWAAATGTVSVTVTPTPAVAAPSVQIVTSHPTAGSPVTLEVTNPPPGLVYQVWAQSPRTGQWHAVVDYQPSPSLTFVPSVPGSWNLAVYAENAHGIISTPTVFTLIATANHPMVTALSLSRVPSGVLTPGSSVTLSATATSTDGGSALYQFWVRGIHGQWHQVQNYSTLSHYTLSSLSPGSYVVVVCSLDPSQFAAAHWTHAFLQTVVIDVGSSVVLTTPATAPVNQPVAVTAQATGLTHPVYQLWWQTPDGIWHSSGAYTATPSWTVTPSQSGSYRLIVYAKDPVAPATAVDAVTDITTITVP